MAPPDEIYRRRIHLIQRTAARHPDDYLRFCRTVAHLIETDELPEQLDELRDDLAHCINSSSHRPLTLETSQWINDEWMRDLWFDVFGPEPPPGDPYPVPLDAWGAARLTPAMRILATPDTLADDPYRPEPPDHRDRLERLVAAGSRRAMLDEPWYVGNTDLTVLLDADDHDVWWTEAQRLQSIVDEAAAILQVDSPDVVHLCPRERFERTRAERGRPAYLRATRAEWRWWRITPRHFQLALARQVAAQSNSAVRGIIGHAMALVARRQAPGRHRRKALVFAGYLATIIALNAVQVAFSWTTWQAMPIVIPAVFGLLAWHSWLKRREELACDVLAASIGMPVTSDAVAWVEDRYGGHVPRRLRWLVAPFREHPSCAKRLAAVRTVRNATPSEDHSMSA